MTFRWWGCYATIHNEETSPLKRLTQIPVNGMIVFPAEGAAYNEEFLWLTIENFLWVWWIDGLKGLPLLMLRLSAGTVSATCCQISYRLGALPNRRSVFAVSTLLTCSRSWGKISGNSAESQIIPDPALIGINDRQLSDWLLIVAKMVLSEKRVRSI